MNVVKSEFESTLKLQKLCFANINFSRSLEKTDCNDLKMRVGRKIEFEKQDEVQVTLSVKICVPDNSLTLDLTANACFSFSFGDGIPEQMRKDIIEKNTIAIMFPYVRSQVSLITTQPDMSPIIIPPLNINSLIEAECKNDLVGSAK